MENTEKLSLEQIRAFLQASQEVRFEATRRQEIYEWITGTICYQEYWKQKRTTKVLLRQYIAMITGLSRAQVDRSIQRRWSGTGARLPAEPVRKALHGGRY